ncbi:hypothetical protein BDF20DRAFT_868361 [Mycotypha africana]|uniref:uncharacterized protein n=1 Tax=Mycotypha africana TaxID=64632 RepID=UPI0022FFF71E|nr:uncharacterized protein BDF20DRAFT_868361 [Mycotypha africana]KAI8979230.1 hypothetical protein BDF20DRAFT_868361 [Mycotypha africana]
MQQHGKALKTNNEKEKRKLAKSARKRSLSSSSTSSSGSPSTHIFSTTSSSDSGLSSMASNKSSSASAAKRKRPLPTTIQHTPSSDKPSSSSYANTSTTTNTDTSSGGDTSSSAPLHSSISSYKSFSSSASGILSSRVTAQRSVPAFLNKLYNMVEDVTTNELIRWSKDGTSFIVEKHEEFAKTVLPRFYKHNTFASFVRQLNMYDFHKVPHLQQGVLIAETEHEIWEFSNPHFQRGRPDLLVLVTRKKNRDKDANDHENISLASLVQDLQAIQQQQHAIGTELRDLHRDNEILWQETLSAREKYQRHQEAIEKILQFLTVIFANSNGNNNNNTFLTHQNLAITMNNEASVPKGLIEEAASLAGVATMTNNMSHNAMAANNSKGKSVNNLPPSSLTSAALSNILSSVLQLYSTNSVSGVDFPAINQSMNNAKNANLPTAADYDSLTRSPTITAVPNASSSITCDENKSNDIQENPTTATSNNHRRNIVDFSKTMNSATRSAQSITQDIDMLQVNIESLASNLGIDPSQFDDDSEAFTTGFPLRSDYSHSALPTDVSRLNLMNQGYVTYHSTQQEDIRHPTLLNSQPQRPTESLLSTAAATAAAAAAAAAVVTSKAVAPSSPPSPPPPPPSSSAALPPPSTSSTPSTSPSSPSVDRYAFRLQQPPRGRSMMDRNQHQQRPLRTSTLQPQIPPHRYGALSPTPSPLSFQPQQQSQQQQQQPPPMPPPLDTTFAPMAQQDFITTGSEEPALGPAPAPVPSPPPSQPIASDGYRQFFSPNTVHPMTYSLPGSYGGYPHYSTGTAPHEPSLYGQEMDPAACAAAAVAVTAVDTANPSGPVTAGIAGTAPATASNARFTTYYSPPHPRQATMNSGHYPTQFYAERPDSSYPTTIPHNNTMNADLTSNHMRTTPARRRDTGTR